MMDELEENTCGACPKLTWTQRLIGCGCCMFMGVLIEFGSFLRFAELVKGNPGPFATMYTLGNVIAISGGNST